MRGIKILGFVGLCLFLFTGCATYQMHRGDTMMSMGKYDKAVNWYSASLESESTYEGHIKRGIALEKIGKPELALQDFSTASEKEPEDSRKASLYKGELLLKQGELNKALEVSDRLVAENPHDVTALCLRAQVWVAQGDYRQALEDYDTALKEAKSDDERLKLLYNRAILFFKMDKFHDACLAYQDYINQRRAMGKDLTQEDYYNMGLFCYSNYDFECAKEYWQKLSYRQRKAIVAEINEPILKDLADY